ncbi:MAG: type IV pili methyl-accepting chemotaxis transducer N-terminal domain-containing protein [Nitrosomonadales bacterium]|nr:type IV pili methyl-accepting chemotaxis transducer N-terminal domain-containing protein [Nitrosomonadales bacterium]
MVFKLTLERSGKAASSRAVAQAADNQGDDAVHAGLPGTKDYPASAKGFPVARGIRWLNVSLVVMFAVAAAAAYINNLEAGHTARYLTQSGKLLMLSERLAKDAQRAAQGDAAALQALAQSKESFAGILSLLDKGDNDLPATGGAARVALQELMQSANKTLADVQVLSDSFAELAAYDRGVAGIEERAAELRRVAQQLTDASGGTLREQAGRFTLSMMRVFGKAAGVTSGAASAEQLAALSAELDAAEQLLAVLPAADQNVQRLTSLLHEYRSSIKSLEAGVQGVARAKDASRSVLANVDLVLAKSQRLVDAYQFSWTARVSGIVALLAGMLVLLQLLLLAKIYVHDSRQRTEEAERNNKRNQDAILLLMNELSELAQGDLTVKATVSEEITGAIADSVNYTTEELRKLVARITVAADQMGRATKQAEEISKGLLEAAQKQAQEIRMTGESVQLMNQSIQEVDASAAQSADVARRTLAATNQGAQAVRNSISGMDGIREQIQDTAKRIKRLGESSQEIGEIVDMISDITEQTNVLALNAAIQAASAGEAGRGFSVVAEEVQRLAERSAEATKQIGALVKAIQGDTHDAVAAMEKSTLGVVEGARLSDVAGQSLKEIEQVSNELATLINSISVSTQVQTDMVGEVAKAMQDILKITQQTTDGTRLTANSVAQLTNLAADLKGSVAGFKL